MYKLGVLVATSAMVFSVAGYAQDVVRGFGSANTELTIAVVEGLNIGNQSVKLSHGEIKNLDMGPGTNTFRTESSAVFQKMQLGQRLAFRAIKSNGQYVIVLVEPR